MNDKLNSAPETATKPPRLLDVRPVFARGESPCGIIDQAVASLAPGQSFVLLAPFNPQPLYGKLGALGFNGTPQAQPDGSWRIEFTPKTPASS